MRSRLARAADRADAPAAGAATDATLDDMKTSVCFRGVLAPEDTARANPGWP